MTENGGTSRQIFPPIYQDFGRALVRGDEDLIAKSVIDIPSLRELIVSEVAREVNLEGTSLCQDMSSQFRDRDPTSLREWCFEALENEMNEKAPLTLKLLLAMAPKGDAPPTHIKYGLLTAFSILMYCRNRRVNKVQAIISLILKKGGARQRVFRRLNSLHICLSHQTVMALQRELGKVFFVVLVREWQKDVYEDHKKEQQILAIADADHS